MSTESPFLFLPLPPDMARVESGPVVFGDDWPGIFLRGDHALHLADSLCRAAGVLDVHGFTLEAMSLRSYADMLAECEATPPAPA